MPSGKLAHTHGVRGADARFLGGAVLRRILPLIALAVLMTACSGVSDSPGAAAVAPIEDLSKTPPVSLPDVLAAVAAAEKPQPMPGSITPQQLIAVQKADMDLWGLAGCNPDYEETKINPQQCLVGDQKGAKTLVVIGDSNAFMWSQSLDLAGKRNGWKIYVLGKDNCGPAEMLYYVYPLKRDFTECNDWQTWRQEQIAKMMPAAVLLIGWYGANGGPDRYTSPDDWRDGLVKTAQKFPPGVKPVFMANSPHITVSPGDCLAKDPSDITKCSSPASEVVPTDANDAIKQAADEVGGTDIDDTPWFCAETCPVVINGIIPYSGIYHINHAYGRYLSGVLADALRPEMGP
jgi:hypothetical protein